MSDEITLTCPHCLSLLGIDAAGDPIVIEEPPVSGTDAPLPVGTHRGLGGLKVVEAEPNWKQENYFFNQVKNDAPTRLEPPVAGTVSPRTDSAAPVPVPTPPPAEPITDEGVTAAIENDLKQRGLK